MSRQTHNDWLVLKPPFPARSTVKRAFRDYAARLSKLVHLDNEIDNLQKDLQAELNNRSVDGLPETALRAAVYILTDLVQQGWSIRLNKRRDVEVKRPTGAHLDPTLEKARIKAQELVKRNEQLREPATRRFIKSMETKSYHKGRLTSIYSLIRDGRELAMSLRSARSLAGDERMRALSEVINPYIQFVGQPLRCEHTGLRLQDIWRYFRHTWTNQYTNTPGRSMAFLVRDRAQEYHPVIGIGCLGSPIVQMRERDAWIGWHPEEFIEFVRELSPRDVVRWLQATVTTAIDEIYVDDFFEEGLLSPSECRKPTPDTLKRLIAHGEKQREVHHRLANSKDLKRPKKTGRTSSSDEHWQSRAKTHLYRSKRALSLAEMLQSRIFLQKHLSSSTSSDQLYALFSTKDGRQVINKILRKAKADRVGIAMADITVCGAVAPYNHLLGGKLVSMLAASPEIVATYRKKYIRQESEIASSMAGRPIVRSSELVFLGTTSLYGVGSSQYNRLRMPTELIGGAEGEQLAFLELGKSVAYGTSQFSSTTISALVSLVQQSNNGRRVNSIFGEGVSPKLRKIRDGLHALNFPADALLLHGRQRIIYGIPVARNLRKYLLGMDRKPDYIFDLKKPQRSTSEIGRWWTKRWLSNRIEADNILSQVKQHTLIQPIRHGARVVLPHINDDQALLFDEFTD